MRIKVAIAGVGNCASALVQGVEYYKNAKEGTKVSGLMHVNFGGYYIREIKFVAAFEVNQQKIGRDLADAIWTAPNVCAKFADVSRLGVKVLPGPVLDGVAPHMKMPFHAYDARAQKVMVSDVARVLKETEAHMLVNFLPVVRHLPHGHLDYE